MTTKPVLTPKLLEAFAGAYLSPRYDNPQPTPAFHRAAWGMYCTTQELCAIAAPREHAKSTALTHDYALAVCCFRTESFIIIVSATEDLAILHLEDIAKELRENEDIRRDFQISSLPTDAKTDVVVRFSDGHLCRFIPKGSGQKMRGLKWNGMRPGLIICDDLEEDEQVENYDRRVKFRRWFYRALLPARRRGGKVRIHGTILHEDSVLSRLMKNGSWTSHLFKAHRAFNDFSETLWPEQFPESRLRTIRQAFIDDGDSSGYSQEYLNDPFDNSEMFLKRADFLPMTEEDRERQKVIAVGCDFAVSKKDRANRTSFTVGGKDAANVIHIFDQFAGRWDTLEWIDVLFDIQVRYSPEVFLVEDGVIWKAIEPTLYAEMRSRDIYLNCLPINPVRDKKSRARPFQKRMQARGMRFDTEASWFPEYEVELLKFTGNSDAVLDDQFDSTALLVKGFETLADVEEEDFEDEDIPIQQHYRDLTTGY